MASFLHGQKADSGPDEQEQNAEVSGDNGESAVEATVGCNTGEGAVADALNESAGAKNDDSGDSST